MTKDIKDYLHYYIGQDCASYIKIDERFVSKPTMGKVDIRAIYNVSNDLADCKPLLRPLASMTADDIRLWGKKCIELGYQDAEKATDEDFEYAAEQVRKDGLKGFDFSGSPELVPDSICFLTKQGFDLFGLIEAGLAIDKTLNT